MRFIGFAQNQRKKKGSGACGTVFEDVAFFKDVYGKLGEIDQVYEKTVAVKELCFKSSNYSFEKQGPEHPIMKEIHFLLSHDCPYLNKALVTSRYENDVEIVLEFASKGALSENFDYFADNTEEADRIFLQMMIGLEYIHELKIIHRDIKPENILIDSHNNAQICDFGIIKNNMLCGTIKGTPQFWPYEMHLGEYEGDKGDVYGMCVTFFMVYSRGKHPVKNLPQRLYCGDKKPAEYIFDTLTEAECPNPLIREIIHTNLKAPNSQREKAGQIVRRLKEAGLCELNQSKPGSPTKNNVLKSFQKLKEEDFRPVDQSGLKPNTAKKPKIIEESSVIENPRNVKNPYAQPSLTQIENTNICGQSFQNSSLAQPLGTSVSMNATNKANSVYNQPNPYFESQVSNPKRNEPQDFDKTVESVASQKIHSTLDHGTGGFFESQQATQRSAASHLKNPETNQNHKVDDWNNFEVKEPSNESNSNNWVPKNFDEENDPFEQTQKLNIDLEDFKKRTRFGKQAGGLGETQNLNEHIQNDSVIEEVYSYGEQSMYAPKNESTYSTKPGSSPTKPGTSPTKANRESYPSQLENESYFNKVGFDECDHSKNQDFSSSASPSKKAPSFKRNATRASTNLKPGLLHKLHQTSSRSESPNQNLPDDLKKENSDFMEPMDSLENSSKLSHNKSAKQGVLYSPRRLAGEVSSKRNKLLTINENIEGSMSSSKKQDLGKNIHSSNTQTITSITPSQFSDFDDSSKAYEKVFPRNDSFQSNNLGQNYSQARNNKNGFTKKQTPLIPSKNYHILPQKINESKKAQKEPQIKDTNQYFDDFAEDYDFDDLLDK